MFVPSRIHEFVTAEQLKRSEQTYKPSLGKVGSIKGMKFDLLSCAVSMQLSIMSRDLGNRVNPLSLNVPENVEGLPQHQIPNKGLPPTPARKYPR